MRRAILPTRPSTPNSLRPAAPGTGARLIRRPRMEAATSPIPSAPLAAARTRRAKPTSVCPRVAQRAQRVCPAPSGVPQRGASSRASAAAAFVSTRRRTHRTAASVDRSVRLEYAPMTPGTAPRGAFRFRPPIHARPPAPPISPARAVSAPHRSATACRGCAPLRTATRASVACLGEIAPTLQTIHRTVVVAASNAPPIRRARMECARARSLLAEPAT